MFPVEEPGCAGIFSKMKSLTAEKNSAIGVLLALGKRLLGTTFLKLRNLSLFLI